MTIVVARSPLALSLAAILTSLIAPSSRAIVVDDLGVRSGEPAHISLSTGFNGVVAAGISNRRAPAAAQAMPTPLRQIGPL